MPSPVGHALGAVAAGWLAAGTGADRQTMVRRGLWLAAIGIAPDLDLLIGRHSAETHSVGAALIAGTVAAAMRWPVAATRARIFVAVALAWLSHPVLDWLGTDTSAPYGVMLLWPFSREHFTASVDLFDAISRRWWQPDFVVRTLAAVAREVVILGPIALACWYLRRRIPERGPRESRV